MYVRMCMDRVILIHCWGWSRRIYATALGDKKLEWLPYQTVKEFRWYVQPFWFTRVTDGRTDRTDRRNWRGIIRAIALWCRA